MYPARSFIDSGVIAAAGSDAPVTTHDPLLGIHEAVNRTTSSGAEAGPGQRVTVPEAIRLFTCNGAYASFEEDRKGSIEPGKLADLVVLSGPILSMDCRRLKDLRADLTMVGGEVLFRR
jgi:predicted amidohydrolase YtcJ